MLTKWVLEMLILHRTQWELDTRRPISAPEFWANFIREKITGTGNKSYWWFDMGLRLSQDHTHGRYTQGMIKVGSHLWYSAAVSWPHSREMYTAERTQWRLDLNNVNCLMVNRREDNFILSLVGGKILRCCRPPLRAFLPWTWASF
jgi:hypothetical protein